MELEVREVTGEEKSKLGHRLKAYKNEMQRFEQDLVQCKFKELGIYVSIWATWQLGNSLCAHPPLP